jgi:hypothetical protein
MMTVAPAGVAGHYYRVRKSQIERSVTEMAKGRWNIRLIKTLKYVVGLIAVFVGSIVFLNLLLIASYHYTYVKMIPEYSGEEFNKIRIGPIFTELPAKFSFRDRLPIMLEFSDHKLSMREILMPSPCELSPWENTIMAEDEDAAIADPTSYRSTIYSPKTSDSAKQLYGMKIFFDGGCVILQSLMQGDNTSDDNKQRLKGMADSFMSHYQWLGNESDNPRGFRSRLGVIRTNNDFNVSTTFLLWDGEKEYRDGQLTNTGTTNIFFEFNQLELESSKRKPLTVWNKYSWYLLSRLYHYDIFMDYGWVGAERNVNFLTSYSGVEYIQMSGSRKGIPEDLRIDLIGNAEQGSGCYSDKISIVLMTNLFGKKTKLPYNIFYGYWDKILHSECMAS